MVGEIVSWWRWSRDVVGAVDAESFRVGMARLMETSGSGMSVNREFGWVYEMLLVEGIVFKGD